MKLTATALFIFAISISAYSQEINLVPDAEQGYVLVPLDSAINSLDYEALPVVSADGKSLYFVRKPASGDEDIWMSEKTKADQWRMAANIGYPLNNDGHNGVLSVSADGNTLFLLNTYEEDGSVKGSGLSRANRTATGWSVPKDLTIQNYYNRAFGFANFSFSSNRQVIITSMQRDDTHGVQDLYVCFRIDDSTYSEPQNLGPVVNTGKLECSPFIAADDRTLYFSSAGHSGYGENDMFLTRRLDDTWLNWSEPLNLGPELNSEGWEGFYSIPASGEFAYLVTRKDRNTQGDIYQIEVAESARPDPVVLIKGKIRTPDNQQVAQTEITYFDLENLEQLGTYVASPVDGSYQILLPTGRKYQLIAQSKNADGEEVGTVNVEVDASQLATYQELEQDLIVVPNQETKVELASEQGVVQASQAELRITDEAAQREPEPEPEVEPQPEPKPEPAPEPKPSPMPALRAGDVHAGMELPIIYFDQGQSRLREDEEAHLNFVLQVLELAPELKLHIEGHTDDAGGRKRNIQLGMDRAKKVQAYLFRRGVNPLRLSTQTFGALRPVAANNSAEGMQLNRRVVFTLSE